MIIASLVSLAAPLFAQKSTSGKAADQTARQADTRSDVAWTRWLTNRTQRGTLQDGLQKIRGDLGRWSEKSSIQHAPPIGLKPTRVALDDWYDQVLKKEFQLTTHDDNWLLFRTRQLDDNDRVWVEKIERRGNQFTVTISEAVWEGVYSRNFTYYDVFGVNLGKLKPGKYEATCIIKPLAFRKLDGPRGAKVNWPEDDRPSDKATVKQSTAFTVIAAPR